MKTQDIVIVALVAILLVLMLMKFRGTSTMTPAPASSVPSVSDVKVMLSSGMPDMNVIVTLIKSGVKSDVAEQLVMNAKHS